MYKKLGVKYMKLKSVELSNFRNISNSKIEFKSSTLSGIYGPNGTGKTSIIEALQILQRYFHVGHKSP